MTSQEEIKQHYRDEGKTERWIDNKVFCRHCWEVMYQDWCGKEGNLWVWHYVCYNCGMMLKQSQTYKKRPLQKYYKTRWNWIEP